MTLTRRQQAILDLLRHLAAEQHPAPTLSELCARLGLSSRGSLHKHVQALISAGLVEPMNRQHRGVRLSAPGEKVLFQPSAPYPEPLNPRRLGEHPPRSESALETLPLLGKIAAGRPIDALTQPEQVEVPSHLRSWRPCYVLEVEGESMRDIGILDGDQVIIEQRDHANDGEIVVALIRGEEATLKRILQQPDRVILYPENSAMEAMEYAPDEVKIQGVLIGQMRSYR